MTRLRSAVTSPPPPRRAMRRPSGDRAYATGPRFATTISFRLAAPTRGTYPAADRENYAASACPLEMLHEAQSRAAAAGCGFDLELVGDRADDLDAEPTLRQLVTVEGRSLVGVEPLAVVDDLDHDPVRGELVGDVDVAVAARAVRVPDGVGHGFGERELQVGHRVVADLAHLCEPGQREPAEGDVLGLRRNAQPDRPVAVAFRPVRPCLVAERMHAVPD